MPVSAISRYRGGTADQVLPLARALKAIYRRYGVEYRLARFGTDPNEGDWCVIVTYADAATQAATGARFPHDEELQKVFHDIARFATRISRDIVTDIDT
jgi:hypothetical protein